MNVRLICGREANMSSTSKAKLLNYCQFRLCSSVWARQCVEVKMRKDIEEFGLQFVIEREREQLFQCDRSWIFYLLPKTPLNHSIVHYMVPIMKFEFVHTLDASRSHSRNWRTFCWVGQNIKYYISSHPSAKTWKSRTVCYNSYIRWFLQFRINAII